MSRILKFTLQPEVTAIRTGGIVRVLGVGWQGQELRLWAEVEPGDSTEDRFYAALTGQSPPDRAMFIGTAVGTPYVAHVYRENTDA